MKLNPVLKVLNGLRPLAYAFRDDLEARSIITINDKNELSVVDLFHSEDKDSSSIVNTEYIKKTIVIVTSQMFTPDHSILITTENQDNNNTQYANFFHDSLLNKANSMFYSDSTPIIVADPMTLTPLVIYSKSGQLYSGYFDENKNFIQESFKESTANKIRAPSGVHFSSFIDVVGNLHSQLVLHSKDNSVNNYLNIYELDQDRKLVQISSEIRLPSNIGPILFGETHIQPDESKAYKSHVPDIIYVSEDGDSFFLNIHKNQELASDSTEEKKIFSDRVNLPFTEFLGQKSEYKPVLKNKDGNPSGIFLADLLGTGVNDIFITAKHNSKSEYKVIVLSFNFETKKYELNKKCNLDTIISYYYIHSVSVCDLDNTGSLNLMVTAQNEPSGALESYVTVPYEFDGKEEETGITFLILGTLKNSTKTFYIPGSVVEMMYEDNQKSCKTSLSPQTSFLSLQPFKLFIGLGPTNLFINSTIINVQSYNKQINRNEASSFLVPNTFAVFTLKDNNWRLQSFFSKHFFSWEVYLTITTVLVIFMFIFIVLSIQEKRKYKLVMKNDSTRMIFNAL